MRGCARVGPDMGFAGAASTGIIAPLPRSIGPSRMGGRMIFITAGGDIAWNPRKRSWSTPRPSPAMAMRARRAIRVCFCNWVRPATSTVLIAAGGTCSTPPTAVCADGARVGVRDVRAAETAGALVAHATDIIEAPHLILHPVDAILARALYDDRARAGQIVGAILHRDFPDADLASMLPIHAEDLAATPAWAPWGLWLVIYKPVRMVVGAVGFEGPPDATGVASIGYYIVGAHRRRGLATEATAALIDRAFGEPRVGCVQAMCGADNAPSIKLLSKLGFVLQGATETETLRWLVTRSVWLRRRSL